MAKLLRICQNQCQNQQPVDTDTMGVQYSTVQYSTGMARDEGILKQQPTPTPPHSIEAFSRIDRSGMILGASIPTQHIGSRGYRHSPGWGMQHGN